MGTGRILSSTAAIVNPKSGNGRTAQAWQRLRIHLGGDVETFETNAPGHAIELTRAALKNGVRRIIAVGGDGTINEVINGFFEADRALATEAVLGIVPYGTGSDFARTLRLPKDEKETVALLRNEAAPRIDLIRVEYVTHTGSTAVRYAANVISFGMGGMVASRVNRTSKMLGGKLSFLLATIATALSYGGNRVRLRLDGSKSVEANILNVAIGNGQYHGGGMWICPGASLDDARLEVTLIGYLKLFEIVRDLPVLYNGSIYSHPKVQTFQATSIDAEGDEEALIEVDGEPLGKLPISAVLLPGAIRVLRSTE